MKQKKKLIQFGAGNIGRSFIGQVFSQAGYEIVFVDVNEHIEDLLIRFQNKALGDTVFRVGRDLARKLEKADRLIGAALLCRKHGVPCPNIFKAVVAGFFFKAGDENGRMFPPDEEFFRKLAGDGISKVLEEIGGLNGGNVGEREIIEEISKHYRLLI